MTGRTFEWATHVQHEEPGVDLRSSARLVGVGFMFCLGKKLKEGDGKGTPAGGRLPLCVI